MIKLNGAQMLRRFADRPVLVDPLANNFVEAFRAAEEAANEFCYLTSSSDIGGGRPYRVTNGLAFIPVNGMLLHKLDLHIDGWLTGYEFIESSFNRAMRDPDVKAVVFDVSSHGGEVHGAFETADAIFAARGEKPTYAIVDGYAHSAGFAIASAAEKIFMPKTGSVGSVGVVTMHVNYSQALKNNGIEVTYIYAGEHKVDGNPYQALSEAARSRIQQRIEKSYEVFVASVARNRGMNPDDVKATQAGVFSGDEALEIGFADAVMSPREAMAAILSELTGSRSTKQQGAMKMATADLTAEAAAPEATQAPAAASADSAVVSERQRISAILQSAEAEGREELANHLAFESDMSAESAVKMLSKAPKAEAKKESAAADYSRFDAAMSTTAPAVGADAGEPTKQEASVSSRILDSYYKASGIKLN